MTVEVAQIEYVKIDKGVGAQVPTPLSYSPATIHTVYWEGMEVKKTEGIHWKECRNIGELLGLECMPMLDALLKLSSIASNFASAANNTKNVSVADRHEIEELLSLVFEIRKLSQKLEDVVEERLEWSIDVLESGVFETIRNQQQQDVMLAEGIELAELLSKQSAKTGHKK